MRRMKGRMRTNEGKDKRVGLGRMERWMRGKNEENERKDEDE